MSITGRWVNALNSVADLLQDNAGNVSGIYSSTTGSSGAYYVVGFADPSPPKDGIGQSLALSILWRSFQGGQGDPSWHYVSGFSGQLIMLTAVSGVSEQLITRTNVPSLVLMHDMVATVPFPGVVDAVGSYLDKLIYTPYSGPMPPLGKWPPEFTKPTAADPLEGDWSCVQNPTIRLSLTLQDQTWGYIIGTLITSSGIAKLVGFTDTYAVPDRMTLQGLTLSALLPNGRSVAALDGALNLSANKLSLALLESSGTLASSTWIQTRFEGLDFIRG